MNGRHRSLHNNNNNEPWHGDVSRTFYTRLIHHAMEPVVELCGGGGFQWCNRCAREQLGCFVSSPENCSIEMHDTVTQDASQPHVPGRIQPGSFPNTGGNTQPRPAGKPPTHAGYRHRWRNVEGSPQGPVCCAQWTLYPPFSVASPTARTHNRSSNTSMTLSDRCHGASNTQKNAPCHGAPDCVTPRAGKTRLFLPDGERGNACDEVAA